MYSLAVRVLFVIAFFGPLAQAVPLACAAEAEERPDAKGVEFFEKHIRPVLSQQCYKCHAQTATKIKGGLLLDTRSGMRAGGETGPAVVPGKVDESLLISALKHEDFEMPPGNKLSADVITKFEQWIEMGAPDPRGGETVIFGKRDINIEEGREFWAFQPPQKSVPPALASSAWPRTDIDRFVLAGLEARKLSPVADASPRELVRRLYFDLIGLPPTPEEVAAFETQMADWERGVRSGERVKQDDTTSPIPALVDKLLASPRFGERWGRHWLDVARYADSNGNVDNIPFPQAWRYRNWVIDALNSDLPYDQFVVQQIAGDLLPNDSPEQGNRQQIATGFLALGSKPRAQNNPNYTMDVVAEQLEVTTSAVLGLTVACARCHDHKFDPIPTSDYYALAGIFASSRTQYGTGIRDDKTQGKGGGLILLEAEGSAVPTDAEKLRERQAELTVAKRKVIGELARLGVPVFDDPKANKQSQGAKVQSPAQQLKQLERRLAKVEAEGDAKKIERVKAELAKFQSTVAKLGATANLNNRQNDKQQELERQRVKMVNSLREELATHDRQLEEVSAKLSGREQAMGVLEGQIADTAICIAGESTDRGPVVPRGFVQVCTVSEPPAIPGDQSGRLQLAQWMTRRDQPLTARVMVNRIWQHLIGRGIVQTVDNFGELGERPTHPQLLDHLALQFMEDGWSIKSMIRTIVLSRTYQMSSAYDAKNFEQDPDNVWHWRMTPRRLDAEAFRDAMLAFSGKLDLQRPAGGAVLPAYSKKQPSISPEIGNYRSVYLPIIRSGEPEALALFDFADPSIVVGQREETTVPTQSLFLLNSPLVVQNARAAAERLLADDAAKMNDAERVDRAYRTAFGRPPTDEQRARALAYIASAASEPATGAGNTGAKNEDKQVVAWSKFCQSLIAAAEFRYVD